jgi:hypothetical protein
MKTLLITLYSINIIIGILNFFLSEEEGEKGGWFCSAAGWSCALIYAI